MKFIPFIQTTWYMTFYSAQIIGYYIGLSPTRCSITQSCPMSKILFALILNPLIFLYHGDRLVGQIDELPGQLILSGNNQTAFQFDEYSNPFKEFHLVVYESNLNSLTRDP